MNIRIPFVKLSEAFKKHEAAYVQAFLETGRSGQYIMGPKVKKLETSLAKKCQAVYAISVGNGTDAIALVLKYLNIGPGDEVITTPNTFIGTLGAIQQVGAKPKLVDVDNDFNLNPNSLEDAYTCATKAVIPVHLTGNPAPMYPIIDWAKQKNIKVIEDAAQAFGATYQGQPVGSIGDFGTFSLHPLKILHGFGDGGFITTQSKQAYQALLSLRNHGLVNRDEANQWGVNSRLDELQAALILVQLESFNEVLAQHQSIARFYRKHLPSSVQLPIIQPGNTPVYHNFIIRTHQRDDLMQYLSEKGIETKIHYPIPIHLMGCAQSLHYSAGYFPQAEIQAKEILSLPIYPGLTEKELALICTEIRFFYDSNDKYKYGKKLLKTKNEVPEQEGNKHKQDDQNQTEVYS